MGPSADWASHLDMYNILCSSLIDIILALTVFKMSIVHP